VPENRRVLANLKNNLGSPAPSLTFALAEIQNLILSNTFRAGLVGLAKSLAIELTADGILVNTLGPGRISTKRSMTQMNCFC
jgi:NAD(P)-dependent dehydrogenase (short-subunit alcohol dehydrogenase family)